MNAITQDAIVEIWKGYRIHDHNRKAVAGDHIIIKNMNMMKDTRKLRDEGILDRHVPGRVSLSCIVAGLLQFKSQAKNEHRTYSEQTEKLSGTVEEEATKSVDLKMDKKRPSCVVKMAAAAGTRKTKELRIVSKNICSVRRPG